MSILEMMYVYFDDQGDIKSISPELTELQEGQFVTTALLSEVRDFLVGKKNVFDYVVKKLGNGSHFTITKKIIPVVSHVRTLDNFLSEVHTMPKSKDAYILIENLVPKKKIKLSLGKIVKLLLNVGPDEDQEVIKSFSSQQQSSLFFTRKNDPYFLLHTITFSPQDLFVKEVLEFPYEVDLSNESVYTKRLLDRYSYKRIDSEL
jgi:hypothetical protein